MKRIALADDPVGCIVDTPVQQQPQEDGMVKVAAAVAFVSLFSISTTALAEDKCTPAIFGPEVTSQYPNAWKACRGLKKEGDSIYVKFIGKVESTTADTVTVVFEDPQNKPASRVVFAPPMDSKIRIEGRDIPYSKLKKGDEIHLYIPSSKWGLYGGDPKGPNLKIVSREDLTQGS